MKKKLPRNSSSEDARINAAITSDPDTFEASAEQFAAARRGRPALPEAERKTRVTMYMDTDVVAFFKTAGRGWQTRANKVLAGHVKRAQRKVE